MVGRGRWGADVGLPQDDPDNPVSLLRSGLGMALVWGLALSGFPGWIVHWGLRMMFGGLKGRCRTV